MSSSTSPLTPEILVPRLGNYLVEKGLITASNLNDALEYQKRHVQGGQMPLLGNTLIELGFIDRVTLDQAITEQIIQLRSALQSANEQLEKRVQERTAELQKAMNKLAELDHLKSNFIANISHELRTPMTHIKGYIELFLTDTLGDLDSDQKEALTIMQRSSDRLEKLIDNLILFSVIERGKFQLQLSRFSITALCKDIATERLTQASDSRIMLHFDPPENNLLVEADKDKIHWVINQLLENAFKFSSEGGTVTLKVLPENDDQVMILVIDQGIGIPEEHLFEIFEPFHQLDGASTRRYSGTGLGLALAREIIEAHGSTIGVISHLGEGSQFSFCLKAVTT